MTLTDVMEALEAQTSEATARIYRNQGATGPVFGVKVEFLKQLEKKLKKNQALAEELYATGNHDAMYLAGMLADGTQMSHADLQRWAEAATWYMQSEHTVPWLATESPYAIALANEWINSDKENVASSGWCTWAGIVTTYPNDKLHTDELRQLLQRVEQDLPNAPNRVRYSMNRFVIALGSYVEALHAEAIATAERIGKVYVEMGNTACKVPFAPEYIHKGVARSGFKKRKTIRC